MAEDLLPNAPIDQFEEATSVQPNDWVPIFQVSTGKTLKTRGSNFGLDSPSSNYNWSPTFDYDVDEVVEYQGKWYKSLDTPNLGNLPTAPGSSFWEETSKSTVSSLAKWAPGIYTETDVFVVYDDNQDALDPAWRMYGLKNATRPFVSADFAVELAAGDWVAFVGDESKFKGLYASSAALASAYPTAAPGDYAYVDTGVGQDVQIWAWDNDDAVWKQAGSGTIVGWSTTVPGTVERSTTAEAQNIPTRVLAGSSDSSNSDARAPSEKGLVEMLLSFLGLGWTWAAIQTFTLGTVHANVTASLMAAFDGTKKLVSIAWATFAEINTGVDTTKPINSAALAASDYAKKAYVDAAVTGLLDYRGAFDASGGAWPTSASPNPGSGTAGAVLKADWWIISVAGTLPTGVIVEAGDWISAKVDTPGNTGANWSVVNVNMIIAAVTDINGGTDDVKYLTSLGMEGSKYNTRYNVKSYAASTTAANAYTATLTPAITTYGTSSALVVYIKFTNANTGAATININGVGVVSMVRPDLSALVAGDIPAGGIAQLLWNGTAFIVTNPVNFVQGTVTSSTMAWWDSTKKLVSIAYATLSDMLTGTDATKPLTVATLMAYASLNEMTAAVVSTVMNLNLGSMVAASFRNSTTISSNCSVTITETNGKYIILRFKITGTVAITFPSNCYFEQTEQSLGRWAPGTKIFTAVGTTDTLFNITMDKHGSDWECSSGKFV